MNVNFNKIEEKIFYAVCAGAALVACLLLFMILAEITIRAIPSLTWYFISTPESMTPRLGMGIANAIWGSIIISLLATILSIPLALGTAVYLQKYATEGRLTRTFRFFIEVLSGTPAIVVGIFGLLVLVTYFKPITGGFSLLSGSIALAILIVPVIERSIENAIEAVPFELEEGSYALGATKWQTISMITLPTAISGIITGAILGFGRAAEESAVVILTAGYSQFMPEFTIKSNPNLLFGIKIYPIQDLVGTLPYAVYHAYENSNVIKESNGFAAAVVLISIVILVNFSAKMIITRAMPGRGLDGGSGGSWFDAIKQKLFPPKKEAGTVSPQKTNERSLDNLIASIIPSSHQPDTGTPAPVSDKDPIPSASAAAQETPVPITSQQGPSPQAIPPAAKMPAKKFLRSLLPFTIPAALLLLIAFLATIPPLHHAFGEASPSLASFFGAGLAILVAAAGLVFGLLVARKGGAFRGKARRIGYAGVAAGICLLCIAGIVCASTASGLFNTGEQSGPSATVDKKAQLAALMAQMAEEEAASSQASDPTGAGSSPGNSGTVTTGGNSTGVTVPIKDALSLGEMYQYGDSRHRVRATVYDYKILPYYFWWFIDYNRFVQSTPASGNSYLVVFIRVENTGDQSIVIPTADAFTVGYNGNTYTRLPYLNKSVISELQAKALSSENQREQYYQWIRELGATKRDYAYLTGQTYYENSWLTNSTVNTTSSSSNISSGNSTAYSWYYLKPGASQAVDGYLIYEVPDEVATNLRATYVNGGFNQISGTRWSLG